MSNYEVFEQVWTRRLITGLCLLSRWAGQQLEDAKSAVNYLGESIRAHS
jgi:hypothetical protein